MSVIGFGCAIVLVVSLLNASTSVAQDAERLLSRDVMTSVKSMPKDITIYHYFHLEKVWDELTTAQGRAAFVNRYLSSATSRFWDLNYHAAAYINAGPGLYLAIDPFVAFEQNFGNTMVELRVAKGTRFINVVKPIPVGKDTMEALVSEGVIARHQASFIFYKAAGPSKLGFYRDTLKNMTNPGYEKFRTLVLRIFESNAIQFIEYNWDSKLGGYCKRKSASAFNYVGSTPLDGTYAGIPMISSLAFPQMTTGEIEMKDRVEKFRELLKQIDSFRKRGAKVPSDLVPSYFNVEENKKIKAMTYGCEGEGS